MNKITLGVINKKKAIFISCVSSFLEELSTNAKIIYNAKSKKNMAKKVASDIVVIPPQSRGGLIISCTNLIQDVSNRGMVYIGKFIFIYTTEIGASKEFGYRSGSLNVSFKKAKDCNQSSLNLINGLFNQKKEIFNTLAENITLRVTE